MNLQNRKQSILQTYTLTLSLLILAMGTAILAHASDEYSGQFNYGQAKGKGKDWVQTIRVLKPEYRSNIKGKTTITFRARGMDRAEARCWHQPDDANPSAWGYDAIVMPAREIVGQSQVSFDFSADSFPHGPMTIRIATDNKNGKRDLCELQLYNEGGVKWNIGTPAKTPPGAEGLKLIFADDFKKMPSISRMGYDATYMGHKPPNGTQDFSGWRFSHKDDFEGAHDPFEQMGDWLRIKARALGRDKKKWGTGILAPVNSDYQGVVATPPFYMECRLMAHSAPGAWPAFWTLTIPNPDMKGGDELDIIEGYGGVGPGNPNDTVGYHCVSHFWGQDEFNKNKTFKGHRRVPMMELGGKSYWSTTFHTYGVRVDEKNTIYYFDNIEVFRHPSGPISASTPAYFLINYAIGGISGWKIDMRRYGNASDMWVDFVRVYSGSASAPIITPSKSYYLGKPVKVAITSTTPGAKVHYTLDGSKPSANSAVADGFLTINKPCTIRAITSLTGAKDSMAASAEVIAGMKALADIPETQPGLIRELYTGRWKTIPDFSTLKAQSSDIAQTISLPEDDKVKTNFALRFSGYIQIPTSGLYIFHTKSDDGSKLLVDGQLVVNNDGLHAAIEKKGVAGLYAGKHKIEVLYLQGGSGKSLEAYWESAGMEKTIIPASVLSCPKEKATPQNPQ